jgi:hypothetical protein
MTLPMAVYGRLASRCPGPKQVGDQEETRFVGKDEVGTQPCGVVSTRGQVLRFALAGAALFYESAALAVYAVAFLLMAHAFVLWYEEPTLRKRFGAEYDVYCSEVRRWWPRLRAAQQQHGAP